jgi:hypothetical protein
MMTRGGMKRKSEGHVHKARNLQNKPQEDELHHPELKKNKILWFVSCATHSLASEPPHKLKKRQI